jgi:hypothetical protein
MTQDDGFTDDQKQYLEGFIAAPAKKHGLEMTTPSASIHDNGEIAGSASNEQRQSDSNYYIHIEAQDRTLLAGGKLVPEELAKREKHPFDMWDEMALGNIISEAGIMGFGYWAASRTPAAAEPASAIGRRRLDEARRYFGPRRLKLVRETHLMLKTNNPKIA